MNLKWVKCRHFAALSSNHVIFLFSEVLKVRQNGGEDHLLANLSEFSDFRGAGLLVQTNPESNRL